MNRKFHGVLFSLLLAILLLMSCSLSTPDQVEELTTFPTQVTLPTSTVSQPTATQIPVYQMPAGFKQYQDEVAGIAADVPQSWIVTGIVEGQYAIFQSYPEDKYIGGQQFQPGDTKCDLNLGVSANSTDDLIQQWTSDPITTILSQQEIILASGLPGTKFEIDSMGPSKVMLTEIRGRVIAFSCFGEFEHFDEIANSLRQIN